MTSSLGHFVYLCLYVIMGIFSRYVVGWMLADRENATLATQFIDETIATSALATISPGLLVKNSPRSQTDVVTGAGRYVSCPGFRAAVRA